MTVNLPADPIFHPIRSVCAMLGVQKSKLYSLCKSNRLELVRIDGKSLITRRSIDSFAADVMAELEEVPST